MRLLYKAPTDNTKPRHIRQSPNRQHNPPKDNTKPRSPAISNAPAWYGGRPGLVWGSPRTGMGVAPDRYGGHPGPVWGSPRTDFSKNPKCQKIDENHKKNMCCGAHRRSESNPIYQIGPKWGKKRFLIIPPISDFAYFFAIFYV